MWSALTKDINELAQNLRKDSLGFVDLIGKIAVDVVGRGGVYAGDEITEEAKAMPLERDILLAFQNNDDTYCKPFSADEVQLFPTWEKASPFSNLSVQKRIAEAAERSAKAAEAGGDGASTSPASPGSNAEWPNEPAEESRQRLLDYSEAVLAKYILFVGDAISPRGSPQSSPVRPTGSTAATAEAAGGSSAKERGTPAATPERKAEDSPFLSTPATAPSPAVHLTENEFFDRYFFRLAQLRAFRAEQRREEEEAAVAKANADSKPVDKAVPASTDASPSPAKSVESEGEYDEDIQVPAFARKLMAAANDLVTNIDVALTGGGSPTPGRDIDSDADNVPLGQQASRGLSAKEARAMVTALEGVVQELQDELRKEAGRVRQLTALLEEHNVPVPPYPPRSAGPSPAKSFTAPDSPAASQSMQSAASEPSTTPSNSKKEEAGPGTVPAVDGAAASEEHPTTRHASSANVDDGWEKISDQ